MKLLTASPNAKVRSYHIDFEKYANNGKLLKYKAASKQHLFDCKNVFFAKILVIILVQRSFVCVIFDMRYSMRLMKDQIEAKYKANVLILKTVKYKAI